MKNLEFYADDSRQKIERQKARTLKQSQWWKRKKGAGICYYCKKNIPPKELTMDHVVPIARDGKSTKGNVVPACKDCNKKKRIFCR